MPSSPGPDEDSVVAALPAVVLPLPHATCPPEEIRTAGSVRDDLGITDRLGNVSMDRAVTAQRRSLPSTIEDSHAAPDTEPQDGFSKHQATASSGDLSSESPSPIVLQEEQHDESQNAAHSVVPASSSMDLERLLFLRVRSQRVPPNSTSSCLRSGSKFVGTQQSDRQVYNVQVEIKYVDMAESFMCGYLRIQGLTDDHPTLTTYFEGEIIGNKHTFKTSHPEWGSSEKVDMQHWARFPAWRPLAQQAKSPSFSFKNFAQREHLFMRWKEYFLVPDHRVKTITGASFEGFYYISFNQCSGSVSGIYFHAKSEKYQQLELEHVNDRGCMAAIEFK